MHNNPPFWYQKSKNFLGRGHSPLSRLHPQWGGGPPPHAPPPSAPSAPRFSRLRRSTLGTFGASILAPSALGCSLPLASPVIYFWRRGCKGSRFRHLSAMTEHDCASCYCCCDCRHVTWDIAVCTVPLQHFRDGVTVIYACIIIIIIIIIILLPSCSLLTLSPVPSPPQPSPSLSFPSSVHSLPSPLPAFSSYPKSGEKRWKNGADNEVHKSTSWEIRWHGSRKMSATAEHYLQSKRKRH